MNHLVWNGDPILAHIGPLTIRWYGVCFALAIMLAYEIAKRAFTDEGWDRARIDRLLTYIVVGTIVGARLGHCLFYEPQFYLTHPLEILYVWKGGLASHGGAAGILIACWLFARREKLEFLYVADRIAMVAPVSSGFIRIGNFFNSEIIGHPTSVPWAIVFKRVDPLPRHPTQLYESLFYFATLALVLWMYYRAGAGRRRGLLLGTVLVVIFGFRFLIEFLKENQTAFEAHLPLDLGQLLSIPAVAIGVWLIVRSGRPRPHVAPASSRGAPAQRGRRGDAG